MTTSDDPSQDAGQPAELALLQAPAARAMRKLPAILVRRVLPLAVCVFVASCVGVAFALVKGQVTYKLTSTMVYTPLPISSELRNIYQPPQLKTLLTFVKTPASLGRLASEFDAPVPVRLLGRMIDVKNPSQTDTLLLSMDWHDAAEGAAMLDRLMQLYAVEVTSMRRAKLRGYVSDLQHSVVSARRRREAAYEALARFNRRIGVDDYRTAPVAMEQRIEHLESRLANLRAQAQASELLVEDTRKRKIEGERLAAAEAAREAAAEAESESLDEIRRRQERMTQKRQEERTRMEALARIDAKTKELARVRELYTRHFASLDEVQKLQAELKGLYAQVLETPRIAALSTEIERLDKAVIPSKGNKKPSNPIIRQLLTAELTHEQALIGQRVEIEQLETQLAAERRSLDLISADRKEGEALQQEVADLSAQVSTVEAQRAAFERLLTYEPHEFTVAAQASAAMESPGSNRMKMVVMGFAPVFLLLAGPLLAWDLWNARQPDIGLFLLQHGVPALSPPRPRPGVFGPAPFTFAERRRWCDQVALRMQQSAPRVGSCVMLSNHDLTVVDADLWADVALSLASREEQVLVVLATPDAEDAVRFIDALTTPEAARGPGRMAVDSLRCRGLAEYLRGPAEIEDALASVVRTPGSGVDVLTAGRGVLTTAMLASRRMDALIDAVRPRYSTILLVGPDFADSVTVEVLARLADGVVIGCHENAPFNTDEVHCLESLVELGAPLWGVAVRPDAPLPGVETLRPGLTRDVRPRTRVHPVEPGTPSTTQNDGSTVPPPERRSGRSDRPTADDLRELRALPARTTSQAAHPPVAGPHEAPTPPQTTRYDELINASY